MPKIITVANSKGGVSKSSLTLFIYQHLASLGFTTTIVDRDPQKTLTTLNKNRKEPFNISAITSAPDKRGLPYDFIIVDTPPYHAKGVWETWLSVADFVLIPMQASMLDLLSTQAMTKAVQLNGTAQYAAILTQVRHGVNFNKSIRDQLTKRGIPCLNTEMFQRVAYSRGILRNSLQDEQDPKAIQEIANITTEILGRINN